MTKQGIIRAIEAEDERLGHFYSNGQYRHGIKFYYGKLEKYPLKKLEGMLENLKRTGEKEKKLRV